MNQKTSDGRPPLRNAQQEQFDKQASFPIEMKDQMPAYQRSPIAGAIQNAAFVQSQGYADHRNYP